MPKDKDMSKGSGSSKGGDPKRNTSMPSAGSYAKPGPLGLGAESKSTGKGGGGKMKGKKGY